MNIVNVKDNEMYKNSKEQMWRMRTQLQYVCIHLLLCSDV